ncbi:hypothetical protein GCM10009661_70380 [Catellatospora chokoriensis]
MSGRSVVTCHSTRTAPLCQPSSLPAGAYPPSSGSRSGPTKERTFGAATAAAAPTPPAASRRTNSRRETIRDPRPPLFRAGWPGAATAGRLRRW